MKKKLVLCFLICLFLSASFSFAKGNHGIVFAADVSATSSLRFYINESVAYRYSFDNGIFLGAGARLVDNFFNRGTDSMFYIVPYAEVGFYNFFIDLGYVFLSDFNYFPSYYLRSGYSIGNWSVGKTKLSIVGGIEASLLTDYWIDHYYENKESYYSDGEGFAAVVNQLGSLTLTVFETFKLFVGAQFLLSF